jgi:hypothetical protein
MCQWSNNVTQGFVHDSPLLRFHKPQREMQEDRYKTANRMYFLSIPPNVFVGAAQGAGGLGKAQCGSILILLTLRSLP